MALPLLMLAAKLLPFATAIPEVMRAFGGDRKAEVAERIIDAAKAISGINDPEKAVDAIASDPKMQFQYQQMLSVERLRFAELELSDKQSSHREQQETIRTGDTSSDEYVRHTRPLMARQSWYGTIAYILIFEAAKVWDHGTGASMELALVLLAPAAAYLGFRTGDKFASALSIRRQGK